MSIEETFARLVDFMKGLDAEDHRDAEEVLIADEIFTLLPTPPFTGEEKAAMAQRVYQHVWQQSASGIFAS